MNDSFDSELLSELLDQRLTPAEADAVRRRLTDRTELAGLQVELQANRERLRQLPVQAPSASLTEQIMDRVMRESELQSGAQQAGRWQRTAGRPSSRELAAGIRGVAGRHFSLSGLRTIVGVLAIAATLLVALLVFPDLWQQRGERLVRSEGRPQGGVPGEPETKVVISSQPPLEIGPAPRATVQPPDQDGSIGSLLPKGVAGNQRPALSPRLNLPSGGIPQEKLAAEGLRSKPADPTAPSLPPHLRMPHEHLAAAEAGEPRLERAGVEFLIVVHLPALMEPTQHWIEALFREAKEQIDDPNVDTFRRRLAGLKNTESGDSDRPPLDPPTPPGPPLHDQYVVQADAELFRLIVDRMPTAMIECTVINQQEDAHVVPPLYFRRVVPFQAQAAANEPDRASKLIRELGINEYTRRKYSFLFEFHFGK